MSFFRNVYVSVKAIVWDRLSDSQKKAVVAGIVCFIHWVLGAYAPKTVIVAPNPDQVPVAAQPVEPQPKCCDGH